MPRPHLLWAAQAGSFLNGGPALPLLPLHGLSDLSKVCREAARMVDAKSHTHQKCHSCAQIGGKSPGREEKGDLELRSGAAPGPCPRLRVQLWNQGSSSVR